MTAEPNDIEGRDRARRWSALLGLLAERGRLTVTEVAADLGVSEATVRRDFTELAKQQLATRTHGGVIATAIAYDLPARYRAASGREAKERIAAAAADIITIGSVVGFNGGTTTSATARRLAARSDLAGAPTTPSLTVVTNALNIATELVLRPYLRPMVLGGVARPQSYELIGPMATQSLSGIWLDVLMLGVDGLTAEAGASCANDGEAEVNALMVQRAAKVVVVSTGEKIGRRTLAKICDTQRIAMLITDNTAPDGELAALRARGVEVRTV